MNRLFKLQTFILLIGTVFAWTTVYSDFSRFYLIYGDFLRVKDCTVPNPITTPCFYGAFAFLFAFAWSVVILRHKLEERFHIQKKLNLLLIGSVIFAWSNFGLEVIKFYSITAGPKISCSGIPTDNVFLTPCFYGSAIFACALITSLIILFRSKTKPK